MAYDKTNWAGGQAITADLMNKIEIELESLDSAVSSYATTIQTIQNQVSNVALDSTNFVTRATYDSKMTSVDQLTAGIAPLQAAVSHYETTEDEVLDAHRDNVQNDTLKKRFEDIETNVSNIDISVLDARLDKIDGGAALEGNTTLAQRMTAAETAISGKANSLDLDNKQAKITANGLLKGDGNGSITAAVAGTDYADASDVTALASRVTTLEGKDTIMMSTTDFNALFDSNDVLISTSGINLDADYIVGPDSSDNYLYYRIILVGANYKKVLISGGGIGGGGGTSSAIVCESYAAFELISPKDENTDYYVLQNDNKYHHYRFDGTNIFEIGYVVNESSLTNSITTSVMSSVESTINTTASNLSEKIKRYRLNKVVVENQGTFLDMYEFSYSDTIPESADNYPIEKQIHHILLPEGGGGSGSASMAKMTLARRTPQNYFVLASANTIELSVFFSSYDETQNEIYNGTYTLYRGSTIVDQGEILTDEEHLTDSTGELITKTFDIKKYCQTGVQTFRLVVSDGEGGNTQSREWRVELVSLRVETSFNDQTTYTANQNATISITPYGSGGVSKTIVVKVDNATEGAGYITSTITTSGIPQEITIPASILTAGTHLVEIYVKQIIGAGVEPTSSDSIYKDIVCINSSVTDPIISCIYRRDENNNQEQVSIAQYTPLKIPYYVYDPTTSTPTVTIEKTFNGNIISVTENLENSHGEYIFKGESQGTYTITISCRNSSIEIPITVTALGYNINPITDGLVFDFNPVGLSNSSINRMWTNAVNGYETIGFEIPEGESFDWYNGGYQVDANNNTYFCIKAGSRMAIKASLFDKTFFNNSNTGIEDNGSEFKCIFKTANVKQGNAVFLTCQDESQINVTTYGDDVTTVADFTDYINAIEIYNTTNDTVLAVCILDNANIATITSSYGENAASRIIETHTGTATLIFESASLKRYQVTENNVETCLYEEELTEHGWIITRIKPVNKITQTNLGLEMKAHEVNITSKSGVLTTPYSEDDIIEFEYNINTKNNGAYILAYEDGVSTLPLLYYSIPNKDNFLHITPSYIILGSDDCDLHIYRMKFYNKALTNQQILMNFYADAADGEEMVKRYERNTALYNDPQSESGVLAEITPQSVAAACPDLKVIMIETPNLTGGKKNFVKNTKIRCIHKNGRPEDNWIAFNGYHAGQGTSSDNYGMAGRNLDIIFGFNGVDTIIVPKKDNTYRFDDTYKSTLVTGITDNYDEIGDYNSILQDIIGEYNSAHINNQIDVNDLSGINEIEGNTRHMYLNGTGKVGLSATSVPNNWFNIKVNIASSENANNALLQKRYNRYLPYSDSVPAMKRDSKIKNDMEFYNCVVFIKETGTPTEFTNDNGANRSWHFYAIGNIGDSKKTDDTRVNIPGDPNEFAVEISDNGLSNSGFSTGVYYANNEQTEITYTKTNYGMKYPVTSEEWTNENNTAHSLLYNFQKKEGWEKSFEFRYDVTTKDGNTISESGTAGELADERQQNNKKIFADMYSWVVTASDLDFSNQLQDWFIEDSPLYWYLFTERYTMIDNRAKNTFWHYGKVYISTNEYNGTNIATLESELESLTEGTAAYAAKQTQIDTAKFIYNNRDTFTKDDEKAAIHNGYRFELWDYDNDTALGINNNGKMKFDYGLEDIDKLENGDPVYNEQESVFWRRIRNLSAKLTTVYNKVNFDCWNAENLIQEFDTWQEQFPEELWRLDFERKYLRPYRVYHDNKYLRDMANGRKKYQRRQFERNMAIYIHSKYNINQAYDPLDIIEFRTRASSMEGLKLVIKPYGKMYINIKFGDTGTIQRLVQAGDTISIDPPPELANATNTQNIIYNASRIQEIGSLAAWQLDTMSFSKAIKLQKLILGAEAPFKNNYSIELTLANPILEELDIRNYTNMQPTLDLTKCQNLKILKAQGTNIQIVNFAPNGLLEKTYLPSTTTGIYLRNLKHLDTVSLDSYTNVTAIESLGNNYDIYNFVLNTLSNLTDVNIDSIAWTGVTQTIMNSLYNISGISTLKGTVNMTGVVEEGALINYRAKWPISELTINTSNATIKHQYKVTFMYDSVTAAIKGLNTDEEKTIYSCYVTEDEDTHQAQLKYQLGNNWVVLDPVALNLTTNKPEKPETEENTYIFGTEDNNTYVAGTGWIYNGATPTMATSFNTNITLYTVFVPQIRWYNFHWYMHEADMHRDDPNNDNYVKESEPVKYGQGETESAPTVWDLRNKNPAIPTSYIADGKYYIFKGWSHLPINISPNNQDIYAQWEEYTIGSSNYESTIDLSTLSAAQLYEVCNNNEQLGKIKKSDRMEIQLGYEGADTTGVQLIDSNEHYFRMGNNQNDLYRLYDSQHLLLQNTAFTFAIDFKCDESTMPTGAAGGATAQESIIASCYQEDSSRNETYGFKIYYDLADNLLRVGFGKTYGTDYKNKNTKSIGNSTTAFERNVIVIRHAAGDKELHVYYSTGTNGMSAAFPQDDSITLSNFNECTAPLVLGACVHGAQNIPYTSLETENMTYGHAIVYWAKVWNKDLGDGECKQLANWCHERSTFGVVQTLNTDPPTVLKIPDGGNAPKLYLTSLAASVMSGYRIKTPSTDGNYGWGLDKNYRKMLNQRVFSALPIQLQSIAYQTPFMSRHAIRSVDSFNMPVWEIDSNSTDYIFNDYITIPSYQEIYSDKLSTGNPLSIEANSPYPWHNSSNITKIYQRVQNGWQEVTDDNNAIRYLTVRFKGAPIQFAPQIYRITGSQIDTTIYNAIRPGGNNTTNFKVGDIVELTGTDDSGLYIYVSNTEINNGVPIILNNTKFNCTTGGWVKAVPYWLRSYSSSTTYNGNANYMYVQADGQIITENTNSSTFDIDYSIGF